jgi:C_GCAxxG_C_C family probable redox protein
VDLADVAEGRFREGYSCSQSVFSALAEPWNIDPSVSLRIAAGFGGGLARSAGTCGCVTGAIMALGLSQRGIGPAENRSEKEKTYEASRQFMRAFEARNGAILCEARQKGLFKSRCTKLVRDAVEIAQGMLSGAHGSDRACVVDTATHKAPTVTERTQR